MKPLRALCSMVLCIALAACAAAPQDTAGGNPPPRQRQMPPTGGPLPPERIEDLRCKVDADCASKRHCAGVDCRCVRERCVRIEPALDPVIDPPPSVT